MLYDYPFLVLEQCSYELRYLIHLHEPLHETYVKVERCRLAHVVKRYDLARLHYLPWVYHVVVV